MSVVDFRLPNLDLNNKRMIHKSDERKAELDQWQDQVDAAIRSKQEDNRLRSLTPEERSRMLTAVCRDAMELERSRVASGLPPSQPAPWPQSTWDFLRKSVQRVCQ